MTRLTPVLLLGTLTLGYLAGYATSPTGGVAAQPSAASRPPAWSTIPLAPNQGETMYWSSDDLKKVHTTLSARSNGQILSKPRDLVELPITRTHSFDIVHRPQPKQPPTPEQHEGVTDFYVILGGSGTLVVGGEIENRRVIPNRPGEYTGQPIKGGRSIKVKAGDLVSIPPNTPHSSEGDAGGVTYMLMKINVGMYPWSLVSGTN
jgi:mannose-6-phosphate isomerase-like protein (cupin superfamily)